MREGGGQGGEKDAAAAPSDQADGASGRTSSRSPGMVRRLYDWVLHWAFTPYGPWALFLLSLAESSFFPLPPDPLLMALCLGAPPKALRFAAITTGASVLGGVIAYGIGAWAWELLQEPFFTYVPGVSPEAFEGVRARYDQYGLLFIFLAGLTPIPYKVFTLSAGVFHINFGIFVVASILSRGLRFFLVAGLVYRFGEPMGRFIDRYFNLLTWVFALLVVLGFMAVTWIL